MTKLEEPMARTSKADGSNHPTTRHLATEPPRVRIWPWFLLALLVLGAGAAYWWFGVRPHNAASANPAGGTQAGTGGGPGSAQGAHATPVVVATARRGDMNLYLVGLGAVDPFYTVTVHTRVDGQIMKIAFKEGQYVKKDDPLIEIDPRPYEAALLQAQGQLDKDQAELVNARLNVQRDTDAGTAVSAQQLSTDVATEQQTEGAIKVDQAAINTAQLNVTYSHITSPIDGRIGLRLVDEGNIVHPTDTNGMAVITQLQPIAVVFSLPEDDIPQVVQSMKLNPNLPVEAYDRTGKTHIASGKLLTIDNEVDPASGTFKCKAEFQNQNGELFPSQFVNARLLVDTRRNAVIVPSAGVQQGPDSTFVYVVQPDNTVQLRTVTITQLTGNEILVANGRQTVAGEQSCVESGLQPGDVIVTDGVDRLTQGAKIQITHPQGGPGGGGGGGWHGGAANGQENGSGPSMGNSAGSPAGDAMDSSGGAVGGTWHHHHATSGPADDAADQSAGDPSAAHQGSDAAAGGAWHHHHHPTSDPVDPDTDGAVDQSGGSDSQSGHHAQQ